MANAFISKQKPNFQLISTDLSLICSFIFSHPLYFSYFVFFSPYLIKFIFFISPLFFTTTLLSFLATTLQTVRSKPNEDDELCNFEDFEIYKIVFDDPSLTVVNGEEMPVMEDAAKEDKSEEEKSLEILLEELDKFEDSRPATEMKEEKSRPDLDEFVAELQKPKPVLTEEMKSNSWRLDCSSMRKEKEWKRTLACKLFEERHNNSEGGEEGMDSLWEASYETDDSSSKSNNRKESIINKNKNQKKKMMAIKKKSKSEFNYFDQEEDEDQEEEELMSNGQLCCLKAFKLSAAGKMNLGMGKPNLVKISKALKGFGWLHHIGTKHRKKN